MSITVGTDPEVMVVNQYGEIDIAVGKLGGSKDSPRPVEGGAIQEDNVLAEFNIDPASTADAFVSNIEKVFEGLKGVLAAVGLSPVIKSSHHFTVDKILEGGQQALTFGCDPDYNCWSMHQNYPPCARTTLRTAGGHVHIGYDNPTSEMSILVGRACDYHLGLVSLLLDGDTARRELYGKAGAIRLKEYGVEYRTLSNFWLASDELKRWVFRAAEASVYAASRLEEYAEVADGEEVQRIINDGDVDAARYVIEVLGIEVPDVD